jgi:hypothetical protein
MSIAHVPIQGERPLKRNGGRMIRIKHACSIGGGPAAVASADDGITESGLKYEFCTPSSSGIRGIAESWLQIADWRDAADRAL